MISEYLIKRRKESGVTLEEIASITRIRLEYLKALESGELDKIPSEVYIRGYIQSYLQALSIDTAEGLAIYKEQSKKEPLSPKQSTIRYNIGEDKTKGGKSGKRKSGKVFVILSVVVIVVALGALAVLFIKDKEQTSATGSSNEAKEGLPQKSSGNTASSYPNLQPDNRRRDNSADEKKKTSGATEQSGEGSKGGSTKIDKEAGANAREDKTPGKHDLKLSVLENTWLSIVINGNEKKEFLLTPDGKYEWGGNDSYVLKLGNAGGVKLIFDGKDLGVPGKKGSVITVTLPENKNLEKKLSEKKHQDKKLSENKISEKKPSEKKHSEKKHSASEPKKQKDDDSTAD
ncbi:MAG: DUF4115 domain-containing protein [Nitrospirae bacterium]|nr:DUF4115 domain-containing protein [Nitrospirota bacterium]